MKTQALAEIVQLNTQRYGGMADLARRSGINPSVISSIAAGLKPTPHVETFIRLDGLLCNDRGVVLSWVDLIKLAYKL